MSFSGMSWIDSDARFFESRMVRESPVEFNTFTDWQQAVTASRADASDMVNHPQHYAAGWSNGAEVIDITENLNFNRGNCVKYVARAGRKDAGSELEDLRKAAWYLRREIDRLEGGGK